MHTSTLHAHQINCVCVCACVRACVRACTCVCVCACVFLHYNQNIVLDIVLAEL